MNGFDREGHENAPAGLKRPMYVYVPHSESKPYFDMAHEWVLADKMFQSQLDESFVAHQYIIAAQAESSVNLPFGAWGCQGGEATIVQTIKQRPQIRCRTSRRASITKRSATSSTTRNSPGGSMPASTGAHRAATPANGRAYQAVKHIYYGPDWKKDVITPNWKFITDVRAGKLANFTWITPVCDDSDHVNCWGGYGPSWVSALVNAVGKSKFWDSTAIFVQWDDWGGLYDHVPPPYKDYDGLGFRVPLLVISPYAQARTTFRTCSTKPPACCGSPRISSASAQLAAADKRATSPADDCFDFSQKPRPFVQIEAPKGRRCSSCTNTATTSPPTTNSVFRFAVAALAVMLCGVTVPVTTTPQPDNAGALADRQFLVSTALGSGYARYFGTSSLDGDASVTRAVIIVHGVLRDADYYYDTGVIAANAAHVLSDTLVVAPQFVEKGDLAGHNVSAQTLYWSSKWPGGSDAIAPAPISTYDVFDAMIARLVRRTALSEAARDRRGRTFRGRADRPALRRRSESAADR